MNNIKIKITLPGAPENTNLSQYLDTRHIENNIELFVNSKVKSPDYWFVVEDIESSLQRCEINPKNIYFLSAETSLEKNYFKNPTLNEFLSQFEKIFTPYDTLQQEIKAIPFLPWMINSNHGESIYMPHERDLTYLKNLNKIEKTRPLSVICSNKSDTPGQRKRLEFVKKIKEHLGDGIDWFGNGVNQIESKWEGIEKYKYHLVIENNTMDYVLSEKLFDSYLGLSYPIYYGGKKIEEIFPKNSFLKININNFDESLKSITSLISSDMNVINQNNLLDAKNIVCDDLNFINRIIDITKKYPAVDGKKNVVLKSKGSILKKQKKIYRIKKNLKKYSPRLFHENIEFP